MTQQHLKLFDRQAKENREARDLSPFAMRSAQSAGRAYAEQPDPLRTTWERDRDRIVHCTAFRRLMYKTQVFTNSEGDHNRTRLSHSLEVQQVARSVGSVLGLNESLCEALALAHDIGHPPFGHRGEKALDQLMADHGGFRHNAQVLRVVDLLERRSPDYMGLNLTREVRQSLLKHESDRDWPDEFRPRPKHPWIEAQVVDLADSTAYNVHDVEDGLLAEMFTEAQLVEEVPLWRKAVESVGKQYPGFLSDEGDAKLRIKRLTTQLLKLCIVDLIHSSREALETAGLTDPHAAREYETFLIRHGPEMHAAVGELQSFLWRRFYRHEHLNRFSERALLVLTALFELHCAEPARMPAWYRTWAEEVGLERSVCDYLAGMTDRFAEQLFEEL